MLKTNSTLIIFLCYAIGTFSQEQEHINLIETDSTWGKEHFEFPLGFAQEIDFVGFEEAVFPKGWSNEESSSFWSYAFAWNIQGNAELTKKELEDNLQLYFNGLLGIDSTTAQFIKKDAATAPSHYIGKIKTMDTRYTKKPMTLHVTVENYFCETKKTAVILFKFSPKDFENAVWLKLKKVKLEDAICEN